MRRGKPSIASGNWVENTPMGRSRKLAAGFGETRARREIHHEESPPKRTVLMRVYE